MAFIRRRRRRKYKWILGQFDTAIQATGAGTQREMSLVGAGDISTSGIAGETCIVRRVVGTVQMVQQATLAADAIFRWGLLRRNFIASTGAAAAVDLANTADFEDDRWLARREWMDVNTSSRINSFNSQNMAWSMLDWKGACKVVENREVISLILVCSSAYHSFVSLRVLLEEPK